MDGTSTWFLARVWKMADLDAWGYVLIWCEWKRVRMMILDNSIDTIVLQDDFRVQFRWIVFACLSLCCVEYRQVTGPNPAEEMRICAAGGSFWYDSITPYRCQEPSLNLSNCFPCFRCFMLHFFFSAHGRLACRYAHIQADQCTELNPTSKNTSEPADEPKTCGQCWQMFPGIMRHDEICDLRSRRSFQVFKAKLQSSHSHGIPHTLILTWSTEHTYAEEKIRKTWRLTLSWHWSGEMNLPYEMHEQDDRTTHDETIH